MGTGEDTTGVIGLPAVTVETAECQCGRVQKWVLEEAVTAESK